VLHAAAAASGSWCSWLQLPIADWLLTINDLICHFLVVYYAAGSSWETIERDDGRITAPARHGKAKEPVRAASGAIHGGICTCVYTTTSVKCGRCEESSVEVRSAEPIAELDREGIGFGRGPTRR
jgi:hypothetical protein